MQNFNLGNAGEQLHRHLVRRLLLVARSLVRVKVACHVIVVAAGIDVVGGRFSRTELKKKSIRKFLSKTFAMSM